MPRARWLALLLVAAVSSPVAARADQPMDLTLGQLDEPYGGSGGATLEGGPEFAWKRLMSQLGASIAPPVLEPARTVGPGGFYVGVDTWVTGIDHNAPYWALGTRGDDPLDPTNRFVKSTYTWLRLDVRKGLPYGFELGASGGRALHTDYYVWGVSVKWALFEGFRTGIGWLPDVAVRAAVNAMTGPREFNLTVPSVDLLLSEPIVLGHTVELTPYVGGHLFWVVADSEVVDFTPGVNAFDTCNPLPPGDSYDQNNMDQGNGNRSTFVCQDPAPAGAPQHDFENYKVLSKIRAMRTQLAVGLQLRYLALTLNGSVAFDLVKPGRLDGSLVTYDTGSGTTKDTNALPRQWTAAVGVGLTY